MEGPRDSRCPKDESHGSIPFLTILVVGILLVAVPIVHTSLRAEAPDPGVSDAAEAASDEGGGKVRLSFFNASWEHVLRRVAKGTGSELVLDKAPPGRFTRTDLRKYSRAEAVRIINNELENTGFRVLEKGRFLVVVHVDSVRNEYQRPRLLTSPAVAASRPIDAEAGAWPLPAGESVSPLPPTAPGVVQTTHQALTADAIPGTPPRTPVLAGQGPATATIRVPAPGRGAQGVATIIAKGIPRRVQSVAPTVPGGLPGFRVQASAGHGAVHGLSAGPDECALFVDTQRQELIVEGPGQLQQALVQLIQQIDGAQTNAGQVVRLVAIEGDPGKVRQAVEPTIRQLSAHFEAAANQRPWEGMPRVLPDTMQMAQLQPNQPFQPGPGGQPPAEPQPGQPVGPTGQPLVRLEGLRGPVEIRDVPGIGMVITGNEEDVETVTRIIEQLEMVAARAEAVIHLLLLQNVSSEALAALLNDVYTRLTSIRTLGANQQPRAAIIPVITPNAVLILAGRDEMESILDLADKLDQPSDPQTEFEVFPLRYAIASEVVGHIQSMYPTPTGTESAGLMPRVRMVADTRTNTVIAQGAPRDLTAVGKIIREVDRDSSAAVSRVQVFSLRNAVAEELAAVINNAIQSVVNPPQLTQQPGQFGAQVAAPGGGGQNTQTLREVKSTVLEFLMADSEGERIVRSGILADIRVTADARANSLIVTAPEVSMPLIAELIRQLDQPTSNVAVIKVFTLVNSDAAAIATLLQELFVTEAQQGQAGGQVGIQVVGAESASSGLIPLRFSVDVRTNSVVATGGAEAMRVVEAVVLTLDQRDVRQRRTQVIKLKNSPAQDVSNAINQFLQSQRELATINPDLVSNVELLEREIIVVPEIVSNSLLISATPRYYQDVINIISRLDEAPAQVIIQALIVEVDLQNTDEFGVELGFQDSVLFDRGLVNPDNFLTVTETQSNPATGIQTTTQRIVSQELVPGFLFNNQQLGNNGSANPSSVGTQGLANFSLGRINGDLGFGGLVLSASSESVSVLIRALAARRNVQILSRPQIRTVDNQLASIQVGQQVPVVSGANVNAFGGVSPVIGAPQQVGIILQVTPRITPDGIIVMEVIANKSALSGQGVPILVDPTTGNVIESPIFDLTEAVTTVAVPDGQTIVLGGMITKSDNTLERKVPWLGDIPILGAAFRYDATTSRRTELLIFLTPRIIRTDADSELIKQVEAERLHFLVKEAEAIHGPLFAVPPEVGHAIGQENCPPWLMDASQHPGVPTPGAVEEIPRDVLPSPVAPRR